MKKVLVAIDARRANINMLDFACYVARLTGSKLTGIFLDNAVEHETVDAVALPDTPAEGLSRVAPKVKLYDENIRAFKAACSNRGINCSVFNERIMPMVDVIKETRFAELLIVDPEMSFKEDKEDVPTAFVKEILTRSECPVVLSPFNFYGVEEVLFAYDGSAASVYAIKQFTYLFPDLADKKLVIMQVNEPGDNLFHERNEIEELLKLHYSAIGFEVLQGRAADELLGYLLGKKNIFVVTGAFGRSLLSGYFKHSTAELIIKTINLPVFIAHHK